LGRQKKKSSTETETALELASALSTVGFVYLKNHGISQNNIDDAFKTSAQYFSQPTEEKAKISREKVSRHGYVACEMEGVNPRRKQKDFKECFDITNQGDRFPTHPAAFKPAMLELIVDSRRLCFLLLRLLGLALGLKDVELFVKNHDLHSSDNTSMMRTLYYPKIAKEDLKEDQVQLGEHTDYGTLTLLFQRGVGGLEVQTRRGGNYVPAPPIPGTILVNIGDLMQRWTEGALRATYHRVVTPLEKERQSIAFFLHPRDDLLIKPLERVVSFTGEYQQTQMENQPIMAKTYFDQRFNVTFREDED